MENKYEQYWERPDVDWHEKIPHHYHVSAVGVDHSDLDAKQHYGPCLRQSFYNIVDYRKEIKKIYSSTLCSQDTALSFKISFSDADIF